jgi:hypothetical protein
MRRTILLVPGLAAAAALFATTAAAETAPQAVQAPCKPWREVAQYLGEHYAEHPIAVGLQSDGSLLQVFAAPTTSTWTLVSMRPDGMACLIGAGKAWELLAQPNTDPAA